MFCRIDFLKRTVRSKRVVATRYKGGASYCEILEFADRQGRVLAVEGFRILDLHTGQIRETWEPQESNPGAADS